MPKLSFPSARAFDSGLAALAALSAGFVAFAMPESLFSSLVETSRLPDFVPAAQPPLGETARLATVGAAFLLTFVLVWALMAFLGRRPAPGRSEAEAGSEAPRIRRADAHPDAPARQPLLARDLGEPLDLDDFPESPADEEPAFAEAGHRSLPPFLVPQEPEPEPVAEAGPELDEPEPQPLWTPSQPQWSEPEPAPQAEAEPEAMPLPLSALLPQAEEAESGQSLSQLAGRIEFGLARKRQALPAAADLAAADEMPAEQEKVGHRLRSAINDLQKIASSGG